MTIIKPTKKQFTKPGFCWNYQFGEPKKTNKHQNTQFSDISKRPNRDRVKNTIHSNDRSITERNPVPKFFVVVVHVSNV